MAVPTSWLRACAAMLLSTGLLGLGLGCKGKSTDAGLNISGTVTYTRVPLQVGNDGVPTGLATDPSLYVTLPARGVQVRVFQAEAEVDPYGNPYTSWMLSSTTSTDINGAYSMSGFATGQPTFVELDSIAPGSNPVRIVGDPAGIASTVPEASRVIYTQRIGVNDTQPSLAAAPGEIMGGDATVNFNVGPGDTWALMPLNWNNPNIGPFPTPVASSAGSAVLAILDSYYSFTYVYGFQSPGPMDLHYFPGLSNPRGSFVEYDTARYPLAYDGSKLHYFGSIAGNVAGASAGTPPNLSTFGDAFHEGVLFPLFSRNNLYAQNTTILLPTAERLTSLTPPLAVVDGLADVMAANLLQSPYLPDTSLLNTPMPAPAVPAARYPARDIRDTSALSLPQQSACSVPNIEALGWAMTLQANLITAPGLPADWLTIYPNNLLRLYSLILPDTILETAGATNITSDVNSLLVQVGRMQEAQGPGDALNLAAYFPDVILTPMLAQFNIPWPTIAALPVYSIQWGADPNTLVTPLPPFVLSMAQAQQVNLFDPITAAQTQAYPNCSQGEVQFFIFSCSVDKTYNLTFSTGGPLPGGAALPAGVVLEVTVDGKALNNKGVYLFGGANPSSSTITFSGNYIDLTSPTYHYLQVRILSPNTLQPDLTIYPNLQLVR